MSHVDHASPSIVPDLPADRRSSLFIETPAQRLERVALGAAWALSPKRIGALPALARMWLSDLVSRPADLPDPHLLPDADRMWGIARDISVPTLVAAYRRGFFPFAHLGPLKWLCPPERCVLFFDEAHIGKNLRRLMRQQKYRVTFDQDFEGVIKACAGPRDGKWRVTWITPRIMNAYAALYDAGYAHSFEVWNRAGDLVGGGYGVGIGRVFSTESQFSLERDTSKIGFTTLNWHLARWGYVLNDGKRPASTLTSMGFRNIARAEHVSYLDRYGAEPGKLGRWEIEAELPEIAAWQPEHAKAGEHATLGA